MLKDGQADGATKLCLATTSVSVAYDFVFSAVLGVVLILLSTFFDRVAACFEVHTY